MKKLYYNCVIEAAYMAKNFGVKFQSLQGNLNKCFDFDIDDCEKILNYCGDPHLSVHPDSLHIFEPKLGDFIETEMLNGGGGDMYHYHFPDTQLKADKSVKVILRNGKPFIYPQR